MNPQNMHDYTVLSGKPVRTQNTLLQKTYALLAWSFLPAIAGVGVSFVFNPLAIFTNQWVFIGVMFAFFYGMCFLIEKNRYSNTGVVLLMVFTFGMGLLLAPLLAYALSYGNGGKLVGLAALMTAAVFFTMATLAKSTKINMSKLGNFLVVGGIVLMVGVVANLFLKLSFLSLALAGGFVLFSSLLIMWQIRTVIDGGEDSHISAALTIFISIYNIFTSILRILIAVAGER